MKNINIKNNGFTLIELMISLTIGLIIISAISYTFIASNKIFKTQDALSRMQESARIVFDVISKDVNMAGFTGCAASSDDLNALNAASDWDKNLLGRPLYGYNYISGTGAGINSSPAFPADVKSQTILQGDGLTVVYADNTQQTTISTDTPASSQMTLADASNFLSGDIVLAADATCKHTAIFQITAKSTNTITHAAAGTSGSCGTTGNMCSGLGLASSCTTAACPTGSGASYSFTQGAKLFKLYAATYFVRTNDYGEPSLYRYRLTTNSHSLEEIAEGVSDIQIKYGEDTNADGAVDVYNVASGVTNWSNVMDLNVSLLMVSSGDYQGVSPVNQTYSYDGASITASDNLLRKVFTTTIAIKNRL